MMEKTQWNLTILLLRLAERHSGTQQRCQPLSTTYTSTVQNKEMPGTSNCLYMLLLQLPLAPIACLDLQKLV